MTLDEETEEEMYNTIISSCIQMHLTAVDNGYVVKYVGDNGRWITSIIEEKHYTELRGLTTAEQQLSMDRYAGLRLLWEVADYLNIYGSKYDDARVHITVELQGEILGVIRPECNTCNHYPVCKDSLKQELSGECPYYEGEGE